jgi:uridine kinase
MTTFARLAERVVGGQPRLGATRLVCVDGPAGSGKTTFADRLAAACGPDATVVHLEDLYAGWTLTGAVARLSAGVLRPMAEGRPGAFHRYDWTTGRFSACLTAVPVAPVLVVEGCGSSPRALDPWTTLRVWIEAPVAVRLTRGLTRDGAALEIEWREWQRTESVEFAREGTRAAADVRVDGVRAESLPDDRFALLQDTFR